MPRIATPLGTWAYEEAGITPSAAAPAVVLLHGLLMDRSMWSGQRDRLAALTRVIALDGPGHGESAPAPRFTLELQADALAATFDALHLAGAIVVGHSWGGMVGLRLALRHPARLAGLALIDTNARPETALRRVRYGAFLALLRAAGMPRWLARDELGPLLYGRRLVAREPELVDELVRRVNRLDRAGVIHAAAAVTLGRRDVTAGLGRITVPTLILCGTEDRATDPARTAELGHGIPGARVEWIEGAGHTTPLEHPGRVAELLARFVSELLARFVAERLDGAAAGPGVGPGVGPGPAHA